MSELSVTLDNLMQFREWIKDHVGSQLKPSVLILLDGEMGVGKTEFVKTCTELLNYGEVQSPTYAFHHVYKKSDQTFELHHVDLYRLNDTADLESIGFWDLFSEKNRLIFVEWASQISDSYWPLGWTVLKIEIKKLEKDRREIVFKPLQRK